MEYLYALYLLSGIIKAFLNFFGVSLNIDFTLLTGSLLLAGVLFHVLTKMVYKFNAKSVVSTYLCVLFYLWLNITIFYSLSSDYSYQKSFLFLTNVLAFMTPLFYRKFDHLKFLRLFTILSPALGVLFLAFFSQTVYLSTESASAFSGLYLSLPEFCGLCFLILFIFKALFPPVFHWLMLILNLLILIFSGGRGPIVITVISLMLYVSASSFSKYVESRDRNPNLGFKSMGVKEILLLTFFVSVGMFLLSVFFVNTQILADRSYDRLMGLFNMFLRGSVDESSMVRLNHFAFSTNLIFDDVRGFLFGYGLGSYGILSSGVDGRGYPHNMMLEIWVETGLVGVFLFCIFFIYVCRGNLRSNHYSWFVLFLFLNAMKSSSLVDLRLFFGFSALFMVYSETIAVSRLRKYQQHYRKTVQYEH